MATNLNLRTQRRPGWHPPARRDPIRIGSVSCCCLADPAVQAVLPPAGERAEAVEVLLCQHHYRVSRVALADSGAVIYDPDGLLLDCVPAFGPPQQQFAEPAHT